MQVRRRRFRYLVFIPAGVLSIGALAAGLYWFQAAGADRTDDPRASGAAAERDASADGEGGDDADTAVPVNVATVERGPVSSYITSTANLVSENEVAVLAEAEGRVDRIRVDEGDSVGAGELLASLARDEAEIVHEQARLKAVNARRAFDRGRAMADQQLISREAFDKLTLDHEMAERELAAAVWKLARTEIRAPFAGRVTRRTVTPGQHVRPGDELFVVTDFDTLIARLYLPEKDVLGFEPGREVSITLAAAADVRFRGRIRQVSPVVDVATGTVKVTVEAVRPPAQVRPGGFVTVDIVRERRDDAVLLPREAVVRELQRAHVFVASDGEAQRRAVEIGLEEDDVIEVVSGVQPGEAVIVAGHGSLKNGAKVKILGENAPSSSS